MTDARCFFSPYGARAAAVALPADFRPGIDLDLATDTVSEQAIPREMICEALTQVLANPQKYRDALNAGGPPLLESPLRRFLVQHADVPEAALAGRALVTGAGGTALREALAACLHPGLVITADPWPAAYAAALQRIGFQVVAVPEDADGIRIDRLREIVTRLGWREREISFLYLMTVSSTTGTVMSATRRQEVITLAAELGVRLRRAVPVIFDASLELLRRDETPVRSALAADTPGFVAELGSLSAVTAPGLRCGWCLLPRGPLADALRVRLADAGGSSRMTEAIAAYLLEHFAGAFLPEVRRHCREAGAQADTLLRDALGDVLETLAGTAAGYSRYLTLRDVETVADSRCARFLSRTTGEPAVDGAPLLPRLCFLPGEQCVSPQGELATAARRQLRLTCSDLSALARALPLLQDAIAYART